MDAAPDSSDPTPEYADIAPQALVQVGFVYRPHGVEGELKIDPEHTDDPTRYERLSTVYLGTSPHQVTEHVIASVRYQETKRGITVILGLDDIDSRDDAEAVTKYKVFATEESLELGEDELYVHDLVGMEVVTEEGTLLGTVANFMEMPAQDMLVVRTSDGEEAMIPAVDDFLVGFDEEEQRIIVRPIEGLLD